MTTRIHIHCSFMISPGAISKGNGAVVNGLSCIIPSKMRTRHATFFASNRQPCMRVSGVVCVLVLLAGCKASEQCSTAISCGRGSYQTCSDGSQCSYQTSDGQSFVCSGC